LLLSTTFRVFCPFADPIVRLMLDGFELQAIRDAFRIIDEVLADLNLVHGPDQASMDYTTLPIPNPDSFVSLCNNVGTGLGIMLFRLTYPASVSKTAAQSQA